MTNWQIFLEGQERIYEKFSKGMETAIIDGLKPDPAISERKGGYLVFLKPADIVIEAVAGFSRLITTVIPGAVEYDKSQIHTGISDYKVSGGFAPNSDPDRDEILKNLSSVMKEIGIAHDNDFQCSYAGPVFNQTTLILRGIPCSEKFLHIAEAAIKFAAQKGIVLRLPWGAHITVARFGEEVSPEKARELKTICEKAFYLPDDNFSFQAVGIGYFATGPKGFGLTTIQSRQL